MLSVLAAAALAADQPLPLSKSDFAEIKNFVGLHLKDAESARWKLPPMKHILFYCGWVNSKNSFGAYGGWQPFSIAVYKLESLFKIGSTYPLIGPEAAEECVRYGYAPTPPLDY